MLFWDGVFRGYARCIWIFVNIMVPFGSPAYCTASTFPGLSKRRHVLDNPSKPTSRRLLRYMGDC